MKPIYKIFKFRFNFEHFINVIKEKEKQGIFFDKEQEIKDHPLLGSRCICLDETENEVYIVDKVTKHWQLGYYISLTLINEADKDRCRFMNYESISCNEKVINDIIEANKKIISFIERK